MTRTITIEIPAESEALVHRLLALQEELRALALSVQWEAYLAAAA